MLDDYFDTEMNDSSDLFFDLGDTWNSDLSVFDSFHSWNGKPMEQWDAENVVEFVQMEISSQSMEVEYATNLQKFQCISGYIFRNLTKDHCKILSNSEELGEIIYQAKEHYLEYMQSDGLSTSLFSDSPPEDASSITYYHSNTPEQIPDTIRKSGRPRSKNFADKLGRRSEKLWEFLMHLLSNTDTCPHLIRWENFEEGTFRFVQSDKVAKLWGNRKQNERMNYEKFSRAMRYYYKSKILLPVPGKRLVYKFGPHAKGWKTINPIESKEI